MEEDLLTILEKRRWLAEIFRNTDGEYNQSDQFKALVEDTKLAAIQREEEGNEEKGSGISREGTLYALFKDLPSPDPASHSSES